MTSLRVLAYAISVVLTFAGAPSARAQNDPFAAMHQFSASQVVQSGGHEMTGKVYHSDNKIRSEMQMPNDRGQGMYHLMFLDTGDTYMVMPGGNMCMHMKMDPARMKSAILQASKDTKVERSAAGSETLDGHPCKIENITVTETGKEPLKYKVWEAEDLKGFPVKMVMDTARGPVTTEYKDVSLAKPDDSLFTKPENCREMGMGMPLRPRQ